MGDGGIVTAGFRQGRYRVRYTYSGFIEKFIRDISEVDIDFVGYIYIGCDILLGSIRSM